MARCRMRIGKLMRLGREHGINGVVGGTCRGGSDHTVHLYLADGSVVALYRDGTSEISEIGWSHDGHREKLKSRLQAHRRRGGGAA